LEGRKMKMSEREKNNLLIKDQEIQSLRSKLKYLARFVESEDGIFCFPDGEMVDTAKKKPSLLEELEKSRMKVYGDPYLSHQAIGKTWEGIVRNRYHSFAKWLNEEKIQEFFPADLVAQVYVGFSKRFRKCPS
jgi:hypothetical protein